MNIHVSINVCINVLSIFDSSALLMWICCNIVHKNNQFVKNNSLYPRISEMISLILAHSFYWFADNHIANVDTKENSYIT